MKTTWVMSVLLAVTTFATAAVPAPVARLSMQTGALTSQPIGHYEFCQKYRADCSIRKANSKPANVTEKGWNVVRNINSSVNQSIVPFTDQEIYGKEEVWAYPVTTGDCEDFALLKRRMLMERGFAPADLLMTVVRKPDGEGHAVLTVRTTEGDFILDNLNDSVRLWTKTPYRFLKRQASNDSGRWVTIQNGDEVLVGSVGK